MSKPPKPVLKGSVYYLTRRVPARYASIDSRRFVDCSLKTDSFSTATAKAVEIWDHHIAAWEAKLAGNTDDAEARFAAARELADLRGFRYMSAKQVSELPFDDFMKRLAAGLGSEPDKIDRREADAILGTVQDPPITVSRSLELYWTLTKDQTLTKSADQLRRWRNPRLKAIKNFIAVVGDKPLRDITGDDMLNFREWWMDRLTDKGLTANSANKDLIHFGDVVKTVNRLKRLNLVLPLTDLNLKETDGKKRPPLPATWIRDVLLKPGALDSMNAEARAITLAMINTGARPSEIAALSENTIFLSTPVPFISIEAEGRVLKTRRSKRKIPLVGVSLDALKGFPTGFPRYQSNSASLSATVNKFLREHHLLPSAEHTMYSLRHSFEDRMLAGKFDDRIRRDLLGHRLSREEYGDGATLEHMQALLQAIAF